MRGNLRPYFNFNTPSYKKKNHTGNFHRKEYFSGYMISVFLLFVFYKINCYMISVSYYIYQFINVIEKGNK